MKIDITTLGFVICLVDLLLVVILLLQYRISKNYQGPGWWAIGLLSTASGILLLPLRNFIEIKLISIILANTLIVFGGLLIYIGVIRFVGKKENLKILSLIMLVFILTLSGYTYVDYNMNMRIALMSGSTTIFAFMTSWKLFVYKPATIRNSANFSCLVLVAFGLIFLFRTADALFFTSIDNLFMQGWVQLYGFLAILITHVLLTFGLIFMINQRLQGEIFEVKESLARSQQQYQTLINSTPDIVYLKDDQLRYQVMNKAQAEFFGKMESDLRGKTDYDLMPADIADGCHRSDQAVLESGQIKINYEKIRNSIYETRKFPVQLITGKMGVGAFIRDITEARHAEEALIKEQYLMNALMISLPDHIYFKDKESRFIRINNSQAQLFGLSLPGEEVGKSDFDFFTEEHARQAYEDEQAIIQSGKPFVQEEKETWTDRPDTWVSTVKLPLMNQEGDIVGTYGISRDITERKQTEREIELKNQLLEQMNAEKDKLFSIIAHDLRSPFNALLGLTELMTDETEMLTLDEMRKSAGMVKKSAQTLFNQLENLLEWSRLQMNAFSINLVLLNLKMAVDSELELFKEAAEKKKIRLTNLISETIKVFADKQMLHSILRNLLANGIKFTKPGGKVTLTAKWEPDDVVEILVSDTGIGMSPYILNRLFKLNAQVFRKGTEGEPSSGLGLIICKELVEKHGGRIWAESEENAGSVFNFTLRS